ncbi:MAG: HIT family protein [Halobacteriovorax sp.]|nr:HIT family protein [Halobacteriovorax sp.]|tara:strand:- start:95 stop:496 length:402 start_codon:yes stop_codon:yes gene_type:complete
MPSVFTKIINGELPCYKIYEDDLVLSFLAVPPNQLGHTLVIPKAEVDHILDVPRETYLRVMEMGQLIGKAIHQVTGSKRVCYMVQGFEVPHFHLHLVPCNHPSDLDFKNAKPKPESEMREVQEKIIKSLEALL